MTCSFRKEGPALTAESFTALESKFQLRLPEDYKAFMLCTNGGYTKEIYYTPKFYLKIPGSLRVEEYGSDLDYLFPLSEVERQYEDFLDDPVLPAGYVPIGHDSGGSYFVINTTPGKEFGSVWYADHEVWDERTGFFATGKISNSFSSFMNSLTLES